MANDPCKDPIDALDERLNRLTDLMLNQQSSKHPKPFLQSRELAVGLAIVILGGLISYLASTNNDYIQFKAETASHQRQVIQELRSVKEEIISLRDGQADRFTRGDFNREMVARDNATEDLAETLTEILSQLKAMQQENRTRELELERRLYRLEHGMPNPQTGK